MFVDYYEILEIEFPSSPLEIKNAFRKAALKWHPDRNIGINTTERMKLINEAYLILKDNEAKEKYDIEYDKYKVFCKTQEFNIYPETLSNEYVVEDEILNNWIRNARNQAVDLAKQTIQDFKDIAKAGAKGAAKEASSLLIGFIILGIVIAIVMAIVGQCN